MSKPHDPGQEHSASPTDTQKAALELCDRLMQHTGDLVALLDRETTLLHRGKPQEITALQARKTALSTVLTRDMALFRRDCEFIRTAVPDRIDAIKEQHVQLQKSLAANQDALAAMKAVSESLLHTIAAKVGEQRSGPAVYGKDAGLSAASPVGPAAISLDRTL